MSTRRQRERRLVIALSATLLALGAGIAATVRTERAASSAAVPGDDADAVSRIEIERAGRADIALERADGDWRVVAPCAIDATDARVEPLLGALAARALDYPAGEVDLEAAGLLEPRAVVRLDGVETALGATDLGGERRYARRADRVALVPEWTLSLVEGGLSALAEPAPFPEAPTALRRIRLETDEDARRTGESSADPLRGEDVAPALEIAGESDGRLVSEVDEGVAPNPAAWTGLAASQVVAWPVPDAPPTTRTARLEATLATGDTRRFELVGNARWDALRPEGEGCAWLFPPDALPPDAYP